VAFFIFLMLFFAPFCQAAEPLDIVINEIAWSGTESSYSDEWLELYNNTNQKINLSEWKLLTEDGSLKINLFGEIPAKGFYLLERTDDETLPNLLADQVYNGSLGNNGENLTLYDSSQALIDYVSCATGWFAGDNTAKQTMERKNTLTSGDDKNNWATGKSFDGTPKKENSTINQPTLEKITATEEKLKNPSKIILETIAYPKNIIFSEILPSPEGKDEIEEWIELWNKNNFDVDLSGWQISDIIGSINTYTFLPGIKIKKNNFLVVFRPETKITLNNSGDGLNLLQPNDEIEDSVNYKDAKKGNSYNFIAGKWAWSDVLTPGNNNNQITTDSISENSFIEKQTASIQEKIPRKNDSSTIIFPAMIFAVISGILILSLKKLALKQKNC
jgi:hypothetical protein